MNPNILCLIREKNRAWKSFQRRPTTANLIAYRRASAKTKKSIKEAKRESWVSFANSINPDLNPAEAWNKVKSIFGNRPSHLIAKLTSNNSQFTNSKQIAEELAKTWISYSKDDTFPQEIIFARNNHSFTDLPFSPDPAKNISIPISLAELRATLSKCKGKAPGHDKITYRMIKEAPLVFQQRILNLYNLILQHGYFPLVWKNAVQIPFRKRNISGNQASPTPWDFRPISLPPCLSRLLEKVLNRRLAVVIEGHLNNNIHGFRNSRGTTSLLLELENKIQKAFISQKQAYILSLDIEKAYDRVCRHIIGRQLQIWGLDIKSIQLIDSFLSSRSCQVRVNGFTSSKTRTDNILPQGSPLSTTLFNVFTHSLSTSLNDINGLDHYIYADNIILFTTTEPQTTFRRAKFMIDKWCYDTGARLPYDKGEYLVLSRKRRPQLTPLNMDELTLTPKTDMKILGIYFSRRLNWTKHINSLTDRVRKYGNLARFMAAKGKGAPPFVANHVLQTLTNGTTNYGILLYMTSTKTNIQKLQAAINNIIRTSSGAFRTTPVLALHVETGTKSLHDRYTTAAINMVAKDWTDKLRPHHTTLMDLQNDVDLRNKSAIGKALDIVIKTGTPLPTPPPTSIIPPDSAITTHSRDIYKDLNTKIRTKEHNGPGATRIAHKALHLEYLATHEHAKKIYTDGSKGQRHASGAMAIYDRGSTQEYVGRTFLFHQESSTFETEMMAIFYAVEHAITAKDPTIILTDSEAALKAIRNPRNNEPVARCLRTTLLNTHTDIKLAWVPAHTGIAGNEAADQLAKNAGEREGDQLTPPFPSFIRRYAKKELQAQRQQQWDNSNTFLAQHWGTTKPPEYPRQLSRSQATKIMRIRMGHTRLTHSYLMSRTPRPGCVTCQEPLTIRHILTNCTTTRTLYNNSIPPLKTLLDPKNPEPLLQLIRRLKIDQYI